MGIGISIEVQVIYFYIVAVMCVITIFNMFKINKLVKVNKELDKESDNYKKNMKKIKRKFYLSFIFIILMESIYYLLAANSACTCGFYPVNPLPLAIYIVGLCIIYICILKMFKDENYKVSTLLLFVLLPIILFVVTVLLSRNDLDALHNL